MSLNPTLIYKDFVDAAAKREERELQGIEWRAKWLLKRVQQEEKRRAIEAKPDPDFDL